MNWIDILICISQRCLLAIVTLISLCWHTFGQPSKNNSGNISGRIYDSTSKKPCPLVSIALLTHDSTLLRFTRTTQDGEFIFIGRLPPGHYYLLVSHSSYQPFYKEIVVNDSVRVDLGALMITQRVDNLEAVIVRPTDVRPRLKKDTLEYNTNNIRLAPNAAVEELLGRLPGLQIGVDGAIIYNGQRIKKILVDGEDVFGDNPTIITRILDASKIAKVQLLDKKSDQTAFTGVDDGHRTKTLNLVMKESVKNGYFGKVDGGANLQGTYNCTGLVASFRDREQFTALGLAANTGDLGFSSNEGASTASILSLNGNNDALSASAGQGIPRFLASALHYAKTWDGSDNHVLGNYQYSNLLTRPATSILTTQTLPDSIYTQGLESHSINRQNQHWGYLIYDYVPDSASAYKFTFHYTTTTAKNQYVDTGFSKFNDTLVNTNRRRLESAVTSQNIGGSFAWRTRITKRTARSLSFVSEWYRQNTATNGYVRSFNWFFKRNGDMESLDTVDQRKEIAINSLNLNASVSYIEPLWKNTLLGVNYGLLYVSNRNLQATYNRGNGKYQDYIDSLSSNYLGRTLNQMAFLTIQSTGSHLIYFIVSEIQSFSYKQRDLLIDSNIRYGYNFFTPFVLLNYSPNDITRFEFAYSTSLQQPSNTQLVPAKNNSDPLHIVLGNSSLSPGFNQSYTLSFRRIKALMVSIALNVGVSDNSISTRTSTDSLGRQVSQPMNVKGGRTSSLNFTINKKILGIEAGFHSNIGYSGSFNYVNTELNQTDSYVAEADASLSRYVLDKYGFQLNTQFAYFDTRSSVNSALPAQYWTGSQRASLSLLFIRSIEIRTDVFYNWQQATPGLSGSTSTVLWNAMLSRNILGNKFVIRMQANNLLNQNAGISRVNSGNSITQSSTNILGRYWLLSLTYRFDRHHQQSSSN